MLICITYLLSTNWPQFTTQKRNNKRLKQHLTTSGLSGQRRRKYTQPEDPAWANIQHPGRLLHIHVYHFQYCIHEYSIYCICKSISGISNTIHIIRLYVDKPRWTHRVWRYQLRLNYVLCEKYYCILRDNIYRDSNIKRKTESLSSMSFSVNAAQSISTSGTSTSANVGH